MLWKKNGTMYLEIKIDKLFDVIFSIFIFFFKKKALIFISKEFVMALEQKNKIVDEKIIMLNEI